MKSSLHKTWQASLFFLKALEIQNLEKKVGGHGILCPPVWKSGGTRPPCSPPNCANVSYVPDEHTVSIRIHTITQACSEVLRFLGKNTFLAGKNVWFYYMFKTSCIRTFMGQQNLGTTASVTKNVPVATILSSYQYQYKLNHVRPGAVSHAAASG